MLTFLWVYLNKQDKCLSICMSPEMVPLLSIQIEIFSSILTYFKPISYLYPLKTSKAQRFSYVFMGYRNGTLA